MLVSGEADFSRFTFRLSGGCGPVVWKEPVGLEREMDVLVRALNAGLMLVLPVVLGVFLARRTKVSWSLFAVGAGTFILSQVLHLPFNRWLLLPGLESAGINPAGPLSGQLVYALALGLSAGLFEEPARYLVLRFGLKSARSWKEALMFGAGHGGVESVLLGVLVLVAFLQVLAYRPEALATLPQDQQALAAAQVEAYWALPWHMALLGAVERIFTMCFHLSAAVLVMQVFIRRGRFWWLLAAVTWHTLLNAAAVLGLLRWGMFASEGLLAVFAVLSLGIVFVLRPREETDLVEGSAGMPGPGVSGIMDFTSRGEMDPVEGSAGVPGIIEPKNLDFVPADSTASGLRSSVSSPGSARLEPVDPYTTDEREREKIERSRYE
jgi:uncharacterized membrane protein YhfC